MKSYNVVAGVSEVGALDDDVRFCRRWSDEYTHAPLRYVSMLLSTPRGVSARPSRGSECAGPSKRYSVSFGG